MLCWRVFARYLNVKKQKSAAGRRKVLIAGTGATARQLQDQIISNQRFGLEFIGFLEKPGQTRKNSENYVGDITKAAVTVKRAGIDDFVIALPQKEHRLINQLVAELHSLPVRVWIVPDYLHLALHKAEIDEFAGIPLLNLRAPALSDSQRLVKRAFDLGVCVIMLPLSLLLSLFISVAIKLDGPGPILFRQERVGENGKLFEMLKFRTMHPNINVTAPPIQGDSGSVHKRIDDPRVTRIGRILRRTSLDELPQIINILLGQMSLVGPRPELPFLVDQYQLWQRQRFAVPQGITGWWQINGRSDRPMHEHTEDDLYYVQNYSIFLDIYILFRTMGAVIKGEGAF
jgi:exopolysaccharide biosynthesis polyprenyl glycosylphosphotransferase